MMGRLIVDPAELIAEHKTATYKDYYAEQPGSFRNSPAGYGVYHYKVELTSNYLQLSYWYAPETAEFDYVTTDTQSAGHGGTCTLARIGIFQADTSDIVSKALSSLLASTANDTTLWQNSYTTYKRALTSTFSAVKGQRYALGALFVGGGTAPEIIAAQDDGGIFTRNPIQSGYDNGGVLTDLPASRTTGQITGDNHPGVFLLSAT